MSSTRSIGFADCDCSNGKARDSERENITACTSVCSYSEISTLDSVSSLRKEEDRSVSQKRKRKRFVLFSMISEEKTEDEKPKLAANVVESLGSIFSLSQIERQIVGSQ